MSQAGRQHVQRSGGGKGLFPLRKSMVQCRTGRPGGVGGLACGSVQALRLCLGFVQQAVGNPRGRGLK